jgi:hypothetical protein
VSQEKFAGYIPAIQPMNNDPAEAGFLTIRGIGVEGVIVTIKPVKKVSIRWDSVLEGNMGR